MLLAYTDEDHGYGNVGTDDPPAQTPLDSRPEPGSDTPNLDDAAFKARRRVHATAAPATPTTTRTRERTATWVLKYGCLSFNVDAAGRRPASAPEVAGAYDLAGDVTFTTTPSCGQFDYGNGALERGRSRSLPPSPADAGAQQSQAGGRRRRPAAAPATARCRKPAQPRARRAA